MKECFKTYNSVAEFSAALQGETGVNHSISTRSSRSLYSFAGVKNIAEAENLLTFGDAEGAAKIKAAGDIQPPPKDNNPRLSSSVAGVIPNVPNFLRGVPNRMFRINSTAKKRPVINIYVECTIYDGIDEMALAKKSNVLANAIAATEMAGYRVNLFAVCGCRTKGAAHKCGVCVNIKEADAPLNLLNIAFPLTNKAFCRAAYLRWVDVNVEFSMSSGMSNYGFVCEGSYIKEAFVGDDGLLLSMWQMVHEDTPENVIVDKINEHIKKAN